MEPPNSKVLIAGEPVCIMTDGYPELNGVTVLHKQV
jgi:hypothetical protein